MSQMHTGWMVSLIFCLVRNIQLFLKAFIYSIHLKGGAPISLSLSPHPPLISYLHSFSGQVIYSNPKKTTCYFQDAAGLNLPPTAFYTPSLHSHSEYTSHSMCPDCKISPTFKTWVSTQFLEGSSPRFYLTQITISSNTEIFFFIPHNYTVICFISHSP